MWNIKIAKFVPVLLLLLSAQIVGAQALNGALSLNQLSISPQPVVGGENVTILFELFNKYDQNLQNVVIQLTASNPIIGVSPSSTTLINVIPAGQDSNYFTYTVHIPSTLQAGEYTVNVNVSYDTPGSEPGGAQVPGQSVSPIGLYVYGTPSVQLVASPVGGSINTGGFTNFTVTAINTGTDTARNLSLSVLSSTQFQLSGAGVVNLGSLAAGTSAATNMHMLVASNLAQGAVQIPMRISYTTQLQSQVATVMTYNVPINFVSGTPDIITTVQGATPSQLYSGTNQTLTVLVQNVGGGAAKNVSLRFISTPAITVAGTPSSFFINNLGAGQSTTESVFISASRNANQTNYNLPVQLNYQTLNHQQNISKIAELPINLQASAIFNITAVTGTLTPGGNYEPIVYTIKNIGTEPAQQMTLSLQTIYPITPVNPNFYITSLMPGQSVNATFYTSIDSHGNNGTYPVTLYEQWRQPNGYTTQEYSASNNYYANVTTSSGGILLYLVIIVVIAVILFVLNKRKMLPNFKAMFSKGGSKK